MYEALLTQKSLSQATCCKIRVGKSLANSRSCRFISKWQNLPNNGKMWPHRYSSHFSFQHSLDFIVLLLILFCVHEKGCFFRLRTIDPNWLSSWSCLTTNSISYLYILHYSTVSDFWVGKNCHNCIYSFFFFHRKMERKYCWQLLESLYFYIKTDFTRE